MALYPSAPQMEPTLTLYTGQEEQSPDTWVTQYIDVWLLLEVREKDEVGEPVRRKLIAATTDPMAAAFQQLRRTYCTSSRPVVHEALPGSAGVSPARERA